MGRYALRRLVQLVPTVLGLVVVVFLALRIAPGDPAITALGENPTTESVERLREQMGLNQGLLPALGEYIGSVATGDLGQSITRPTEVTSIIRSALPVTAVMATAALLIAVVGGLALGTLASYLSSRGRDAVDHGLTSLAIFMESTPHFVLGLLALLFFVLQLGWFPSTGVVDLTDLGGSFERLALPVTILALGSTASIARVVRTSVLDVLNDDYVRTARALGESPLSALRRHAVRNALLPVITMSGIEFGRLLGGTVIMELIFSLPGMGSSLLDAIEARDYPVVQGLVLVYAALYVLVNLGTDLLYQRADPRVVLR